MESRPTCPYEGCARTYKHRDGLQKHIRDRHMEHKYVCSVPECGYSTARRYLQLQHSKTHDKVRVRTRYKKADQFYDRESMSAPSKQLVPASAKVSVPSKRVVPAAAKISIRPPSTCTENRPPFAYCWLDSERAMKEHTLNLVSRFEGNVRAMTVFSGTCGVCDIRIEGKPVVLFEPNWSKLTYLENPWLLGTKSFEAELTMRDSCFDSLKHVPLSLAGMHPGRDCSCANRPLDPHVLVCSGCATSIGNSTIPKMSVTNTWIGPVPACLRGLTLPERMLISPGRLKLYVVKLRCWTMKESEAQRGVKGHATVFGSPTEQVVQIVPRPLHTLRTYLRVLFVGSVKPDRTAASKVLGVRLKRIWKAIEWLASWNTRFGVNFKIEVIKRVFAEHLSMLFRPNVDPFEDEQLQIPDFLWDDACDSFNATDLSSQNFGLGNSSYVPSEFIDPPLPPHADECVEDDIHSSMSISGTVNLEHTESSELDRVEWSIRNLLNRNCDQETTPEDYVLNCPSLDSEINAKFDNARLFENTTDPLNTVKKIPAKNRKRKRRVIRSDAVQLVDQTVVPDNPGATDEHALTADNFKWGSKSSSDPFGDTLVLPHEKKPISDYDNDEMWLLAYPHLFPYGVGGPHAEKRRHFSLELWVKHQLLRSDDRFRKDSSFLFHCFNLIQRHKVARETSFFCANNPRFADDSKLISSVTLHTLKSLLQDLEQTSAKHKTKAFEAKCAKQPQLQALFRNVISVSNRVPGSDFRRKTSMRTIEAFMYAMGQPGVFVTLNLADIHDSLRLAFVHDNNREEWEKIFMSGSDFSILSALPNTEMRAQQVADMPVENAQYFDVVIKAWIKTACGWDHAEGAGNMIASSVEEEQRLLFGRVAGYWGGVETQLRGSLHLHMLIWLKDLPNPEDLQVLTERDLTMKSRFIKYLDHLIKAEFPSIATPLDTISTFEHVEELGAPEDNEETMPPATLNRWPTMHDIEAIKNNCVPLFDVNESNWHLNLEDECNLENMYTSSFSPSSECSCPRGDPLKRDHKYSIDAKNSPDESILRSCEFHARYEALKVNNVHITSLRPDLASSDKESAIELAQLLLACQMHNYPFQRHNECCFKGRVKKKRCRFSFERALRDDTSFEGATLLQRCTHGFLNPYNEFTMRALRCNHDIRFIGSGGDARAAGYYVSSYITKGAPTLTDCLPAFLVGLQNQIRFGCAGSTGTTVHDTSSLVGRIVNSTTVAKQKSGTEIALHLLNNPWSYESHCIAHLDLAHYVSAFVDQEGALLWKLNSNNTSSIDSQLMQPLDAWANLTQSDDEYLECVEEEKPLPVSSDASEESERIDGEISGGIMSFDREGRIRMHSGFLSYWHRPPELFSLTVYDFAACTNIRKIEERDSVSTNPNLYRFVPAYSWKPGERDVVITHPCAETHLIEVTSQPGEIYNPVGKMPKIPRMYNMPAWALETETSAKLFLLLYHAFHSSSEGLVFSPDLTKKLIVDEDLALGGTDSDVAVLETNQDTNISTCLPASSQKITTRWNLWRTLQKRSLTWDASIESRLRTARFEHWRAMGLAKSSRQKNQNALVRESEREKQGLSEPAEDAFFEAGEDCTRIPRSWLGSSPEETNNGAPCDAELKVVMGSFYEAKQDADGLSAKAIVKNACFAGWGNAAVHTAAKRAIRNLSNILANGGNADNPSNLRAYQNLSTWRKHLLRLNNEIMTLQSDDGASHVASAHVATSPLVTVSTAATKQPVTPSLSPNTLDSAERLRLSQRQVLLKNGLLDKQAVCYLSWTDHLIDLMTCSDIEKCPQKLGCLLGAGGTGKSQVINSITEFLDDVGRSSMMVRIAMTANAAAAISGTTYHLFLCASRNKDLVQTDSAEVGSGTRTRLSAKMHHVHLLVFDEVGIVPLAALAELHKRMVIGKGGQHSSNPRLFGGASMLAGGDFLQLGPISGKPLWSFPFANLYAVQRALQEKRSASEFGEGNIDADDFSEEKLEPLQSATKLSNLNAKNLLGLHVWKTIAAGDVIFLDKQYRQTGVLKDICNNLRRGCYDDKHSQLLRSRIATKENKLLLDPKFAFARAVVRSNALREYVNNTRMHHWSEATGQRILVSRAVDKINIKTGRADITEDVLKRQLYGAPESKTSYLPTMLLLCVGAPYVIKLNDSKLASLGLCNGVSGILEKVILDPREPNFDARRTAIDSTPHFLSYIPSVLLRVRNQHVRLKAVDLSGIECGDVGTPSDETLDGPTQNDSLAPGVVPISRGQGPQFNFPFGSKSDQAIASITRTQLPMASEWARTIYQAQGGTYCPLLTEVSSKDNFYQLYVKMSRGVSLEDIVFISDVNISQFKTKKPSIDRLREIHSLRLSEHRHLTSLLPALKGRLDSLPALPRRPGAFGEWQDCID